MKRKNKKISGAKALIILFVSLLAVTAAVFAVYFGSNKLLRSSYPLEYSEYVNMYSDMYGLDKFAVYAFIRTESGFDTQSESYLGARGLMQIMPETFEWIRYRLGEENDADMTYDRMYEADDNIRYGCYLLSYLSEQFGGGLSETAAAYHAGAGSVSSWLENPDYAKNGTLTDIPNSDTAHYVDKIKSAYDMYCKLYR